MKIFFADSTKHLRRSFARPGLEIGKIESYFFSDGERGYRLKEDVKGKQTAIIASILPDPVSLFDLLALHRVLNENDALRITVVVPYLGYARQDRPNRKGEASLGMMVVELIQKMKASKFVLLDVHSDLIRQGFDDSRVTELSALPLFAEAVSKQPPDVIVSPDAGSVSRAERLAELLEPHPAVAFIDKVRPRFNVAVAKRLHGDVRRKKVLVIDDMIDTGGTLAEAVRLVCQQEPQGIRLAATHGLFSRNARKRLSRLPIDEIMVTNTLPQIRHPKLRILNITPVIVDGLK